MRVEWDLDGFEPTIDEFRHGFEEIARRFSMDWRLALSSQPCRAAILVSRYDHCLADLLHRHRAGELACEIPLIVSNHQDARPLASQSARASPHSAALRRLCDRYWS